MITVICVLKSGGCYDASWVVRLSNGVRRHLSFPHGFVCLTDMKREVLDAGIEAEPLEAGWPGWWSKIEMFRPGLFTGPTLYFDLDTIIVGSLDAIAAHPHRFTMGHEYYRPRFKCSTAMAWRGDHSEIWRQMKLDPAGVRARYRGRSDHRIGDQAFIEDIQQANGVAIETFRDLFGEMSIASYKEHAREAVPAGAAAVAFHGRPKPPDAGGWVTGAWR